jgi:ABC-type transporter Mla subunit MlaD
VTTIPVKRFKDQIEELHENALELSKHLDDLDNACDDSGRNLEELKQSMARAIELREIGKALRQEANEITCRAPTAIFEVSESVQPALSAYSRQVYILCLTICTRAETLCMLAEALVEEHQMFHITPTRRFRNWLSGLFSRKEAHHG